MPNAAGWHCAMQSDRRMPPPGARRGESASPDPQLTFDWSASPRTESDAAEPPVSPVHIEHSTEGVSASAHVDPGAHHDGRYGPGHPWHHHPLGDNAAPIPADAIPPANGLEDTFDRELPRRGPKRIIKARELLDAERRALEAGDCRTRGRRPQPLRPRDCPRRRPGDGPRQRPRPHLQPCRVATWPYRHPRTRTVPFGCAWSLTVSARRTAPPFPGLARHGPRPFRTGSFVWPVDPLMHILASAAPACGLRPQGDRVVASLLPAPSP